jgi:hypothetical protein
MQIGGLGYLGLTLPQWLQARAAGEDASCILLWLAGGISTVDSLDMKPDAPTEYRGEFKPIATTLPGVTVCEHMPLLARQMHHVCQVRTVVHEGSQHAEAHHWMLTGWPQVPDVNAEPTGVVVHPCYASVVAEQKGWRNSMPPAVQLSGGRIGYHHSGYLGSEFNPLHVKADPNAADFRVEDLSPSRTVGDERQTRRRRLLAELDDLQRLTDRNAGAVFERNRFVQQAYDLMTSPAAKEAFRIDREPDKLRDRYGRCREGQATLLARRLVQAGVRFVTVEFDGYDTHDRNFERLKGTLLPTLDRAYSALLADLADRGMLERTLVICMGEFGRTPKVNGAAGRDHYPLVNSICLSGAGVKAGTIVGRTSERCETVVGASHSTHDLAATIYHLLGVDHLKEYHTLDRRPILTTDNGKPIEAVFA